MINEIYLDNSATTRVCSKSIEKTIEVLQNHYGNPSSLHKKGFEAEKIILEAKKNLALALSCQSEEIIFTSGATEANNLAIIGCAMANKRRGNKIVTTAIEHPSVLEAMKHLESLGFEVCYVNPNQDGEITVEDFCKNVDQNTILASLMFVNNETGLVLPIEKISKKLKQINKDIKIHVDGVQGFLKLPLKLKQTDIDMFTISGHKIYAPKGVGALYLKKGTRIMPNLFGGGQQNSIRPGTESTALIAGMGASIEYNFPLLQQNLQRYKDLKTYLLNGLNDIKDIQINSTDSCAPYVVNISVSTIRSEVLLHFLEQYNIFVSSGSACSKGKKSHVLTALGLPQKRIDSAIRISFSAETTTQQIDELIIRLQLALDTLHR